MDTTQIIILAAGKGTRMGGDLPKALTKLGHQPMLEHVLDTVESLDLPRKPILVVGYQEDLVKEVIGDRGIYVTQSEQKGTGHAVAVAMPYLDQEITSVIVLLADQPYVSTKTLKRLVEVKKQSKNPLTMGTAVITDDQLFEQQFYNFGRIIRDDKNNIVANVEARDATEEQKKIREVNPIYFCCDRDWLQDSLLHLDSKNDQGELYLTDLVKIAFQEGAFIGSILVDEREALGANTPEQLTVLERYLES
ncbi:NTP transferase domain-containing protein [Patescibacteria group bacterium]|nr:NTP transferase domain-containing protein [Patescibacteria group bacterium]